MKRRLRRFAATAALASTAVLAASLMFGSAGASAYSPPCWFFFCHTTTTTTTSTQSSSTTTTTVTSTATTTTTTPTTSTTTTSTSTGTVATIPASGGLPGLTEIPSGAGSHGYPYDAVPQTPAAAGAPFINLSAVGYAEREFTMSGNATDYGQSGGWGSNGNWGVSAQGTTPYKTRIIVRYPTNPANFNGTVIFEWLNDTTGGDQDPVWSELYNEAISEGYAYVGVTAQTSGMADLKAWDPARYGSLGDGSDSQSYDIFTQAAKVIRADYGTLLGGDVPKKLIGAGDSQSAIRLDTYVNAIQPVTHAFDGFLAVGRAVVAAPLGNGLVSLSPFPAMIRTNNSVPFIQLNTQGDVFELDAGASRQPDNNDLRTWELTGAAHIDQHEATYEIETIAREEPTTPVPSCTYGTPISGSGTALDGINQVNNMPLFEAEDAALNDLDNWVVNGVPAPHAPSPISTTSLLFGLYDLPNTDQYGIGQGGLRMPEANVPTEDYGVINLPVGTTASLSNPISLLSELESALSAFETGGITNSSLRTLGLCLLSGYFTDLGNSSLSALYPSTAVYASKYTAAANADVAAGFLTPADASAAIANANAGIGPLQVPPQTVP